MGLWSFVKGAGKKLIGKDDTPEDAINKELADLGLDASDVDISVDGGKVVMKGKALDQETREKIILAAGNVDGIETVEDAMEGDSAGTVFHTVESGDTLSAIAQKTLGKASAYHAIFEAKGRLRCRRKPRACDGIGGAQIPAGLGPRHLIWGRTPRNTAARSAHLKWPLHTSGKVPASHINHTPQAVHAPTQHRQRGSPEFRHVLWGRYRRGCGCLPAPRSRQAPQPQRPRAPLRVRQHCAPVPKRHPYSW